MRLFLFALALVLTAGTAHADRVVVRNSPGAVVTSAQADADTMASTGRLRHSGRATCREGIGCGSTPEAAVSNCCYWGRYPVREKAVARSANGRWFAVVRYR
jgi:hypothetical protein